jgi:4-hydroxy-tetrahydrodipicolinate reductase
MAVRVGVIGATGRMGTAVCASVAAEPHLDLVAAIGRQVGETRSGVTVTDRLDVLLDVGAEVVVDFTVAEAARQHLAWLAGRGVHAVSGTTGLTGADLDHLRAGFTTSNCLIAANFAIGAVLMMRLAEMAAPFFDTAEIIEMHHDAKADAPSGTAVATAMRLDAARSTPWAPDPTTREVWPGARGARGARGADDAEGVRVHSVRMRGMVASQEVVFGTTAQTLVIRHDTFDRTSFMPGVVLACRRIGAHSERFTIGLEPLLGL